MKVSNRRIKKAQKKIATGRKLKPTEHAILRTGNIRRQVNAMKAATLAKTAITAGLSMAQLAVLTASPRPLNIPAALHVAKKTIAAFDIARTAAANVAHQFNELNESINRIRNEGKIQKR